MNKKEIVEYWKNFFITKYEKLLKSNTIYPFSCCFTLLHLQILRSIFLIIDETFKIIIN